MESGPLSLHVSGTLISKLVHEYCSNASNCNGRLFGEVISATKTEVTDDTHSNAEYSSICVQGFTPLSYKKSLADKRTDDPSSCGMQSALCTGLYRIRVSQNRLTVLEKSMHRNLCCKLCRAGSERHHIATLLITHHSSSENCCLSWKIRAYYLDACGKFRAMKVFVSNLEGSLSDSYCASLNLSLASLSSPVNSILSSFQSSLYTKESNIKVVKATREFTNNLIEELDNAVDELAEHEMLLQQTLKEGKILEVVYNALKSADDRKKDSQDSKNFTVDAELTN